MTEKAFPSKNFNGMDLRDYFAAKALQSLMGRNWEHIKTDKEKMDLWVRSSYYLADLMMAERIKKDDNVK